MSLRRRPLLWQSRELTRGDWERAGNSSAGRSLHTACQGLVIRGLQMVRYFRCTNWFRELSHPVFLALPHMNAASFDTGHLLLHHGEPIYAHSLGLVLALLFLGSFLLHWWFSMSAANAEALRHEWRGPDDR